MKIWKNNRELHHSTFVFYLLMLEHYFKIHGDSVRMACGGVKQYVMGEQDCARSVLVLLQRESCVHWLGYSFVSHLPSEC